MKGEKRTESILNVSFYRRWGGETELSSALLPKRLVSILLVLVLTALSLSAQNNLKWSWHSPDERISSYRWQLDGEKENRWTVVESSVTSIILPFSGDDTLFVQASYDGINWGQSGFLRYSKYPEYSISVNMTPYSKALYRFYNGYDVSAAVRTRTNSVYGLAATVEFDFQPVSWIRIYPEIGFAFHIKEHTVIPRQKNVYYLKAGAGADYSLSLSGKSSVYAGLFGGVMMHINNKKASITPYFGARIGYRYEISEHFSIGAVGLVTFALFSGRKQALMDSMTILIDPVGVTLTYRF